MDPAPPHPLEASWTGLLTCLGATAEECRLSFAHLARYYASGGRHYHTLGHVADMLETVASLRRAAPPGPALLLAVWFHDVIYDPRAADNEEKSAAHAREVLQPLRVPEHILAETARLILLTRTHRATPEDADGAVLLDADLAVLGADAPAYDRYARAIRQEYAWVPEEDYRKGRARVLQGFLERPRIYRTSAMFEWAEDRARQNLRRELESLR
jgi:predicted metal-dependent HD superfamily phosphohydrolase